jgi:hypothetical protein
MENTLIGIARLYGRPQKLFASHCPAGALPAARLRISNPEPAKGKPMYEKFLLCALIFSGGVIGVAVVHAQHMKGVVDAFLDHLLLQEQALEEKVEAEVAKRFNG